jgi:hypothetical protein
MYRDGMTTPQNRLSSTRASLALARLSLSHYVGTPCEPDYRAMVARYEHRVAALEKRAA